MISLSGELINNFALSNLKFLCIRNKLLTSRLPLSNETRNAFGNYRNVLKEVSFNPLMAENLSFLRSKSAAYMMDRYKIKTSAGKYMMYVYIFCSVKHTNIFTSIFK